ncbi:hypothetical protein LHK_01892 [Laribacter hongkongensis HLHK9]|uniref:Glycine zipper 2TM domain-containing protein n=3 Tax=Laribacter hongkongensis TaxID=168471 RepID=C1D8T6_LARHH|nr:hypothetical protein LHK_01892 [Laribacter hongkongensis HLHK9]ASJ24817.1 hypothetical protein LHGZ1_1986 [Laribacter hongkongensis]
MNFYGLASIQATDPPTESGPVVCRESLDQEITMSRKLTTSLLLLTLMGSLAGCAGMSRSERNTVAGAAIGGVAGSVLTDGSALGTVGGAAIGGLIGNKVK